MSNLGELSIAEASKKLSAKEISAVELARACKENIDAKNPSLNAYLEVFDDIEAQAKKADERRALGETHPLLGIPLAIKDNILIEGKRASAASKILEGYTATYDATVVRKLKEAGAIFLGRTNMDEFALGSSTENSTYGPTKNPHDVTRVAGGTSGGSAAAVAANMALGALGSDTGGSVRNPASFCGVVGFKPTYGTVSRSGLIAAASSFDQIGPLTKTVEDAELLFGTVRGKDVLESTSIDENFYKKSSSKKVIGVPRDFWAAGGVGIDSNTLDLFYKKIDELKNKGYEIRDDMQFSSLAPALASYYIINFAEVSSNLSRFDGVRYGLSLAGTSQWEDYAKTRGQGFGPETRRRIMLGTYVLSAGYYDSYYGKAVTAREQLRREYSKAFESVDFIATPTMPGPAFVVGEKSDPLALYFEDLFTVPANLTGNPAISIPMGKVTELPVGIQFTAAHGDEAGLFAVGKAFQKGVK